MKIAAIALATMAGAASAQSVNVTLTHDDADGVINRGDSVTWTLSVSHSGFAPGAVVSGGNMSVLPLFGALGTTTDFAYAITPNGGTNGGTSTGSGIDLVNWTNSFLIENFGGDPTDATNPYVIGSFGFTAGQVNGLQVFTLLTGGAASPFVSISEDTFTQVDYSKGDIGLTVSTQALEIVPTPASAGLLGLGGLVAARRRRN